MIFLLVSDYVSSMRVLKFGGGCLRDLESCQQIIEVVRRARRGRGEIIVVVSALYDVTNRLIEAVQAAARGKQPQVRKILRALRAEHEELATELLSKSLLAETTQRLSALFGEIETLCESVASLTECSQRSQDRCIGYGELLSATLVAAMLSAAKLRAQPIDARSLIVTDDQYGNAAVEQDQSRAQLQAAHPAWRGTIPIITGFIAATRDGIPTTIGRNGSDYTAALIGALLQADAIELWHDVDGVMSADPSVVPDAFPLPTLTYAEAMEMAYFGAKILHPRAVIPAINANIPLYLRNIYNPDFAGTCVTTEAAGSGSVKGITAIRTMSLLSLEGAGMIGVNGVAARLFGALAETHINVTLISQGSSEQSICCVVQRGDAQRACAAVRAAFREEFARGLIRSVESRDDIVVVAVVGGGMRGTPGIAATLFGALGKNKINVIAVAQGSSELNISLVVHETDCAKALNVIHGAFHLAQRHVHVVVVGKGTIGNKLLEQIADGQARLARDRNLQLHVVGLADRSRFLFRPEGIALDRWRTELARGGKPLDVTKIGAVLQESRLANLILVDATASEHVAAQYPHWLGNGISVVTPNKKANTLTQHFYDNMMAIVRRRNSYYLYETCVGAGLPVISTLHDLIDSGDRILHIEAALSGTLGYLFSELERGTPFSQIVRAALKLGYTEPDPRDDLSGMDVARKLLILARTMGARVSLPQVKVEPLLPAGLRKGGTVEQFFKKLPAVDAAYAKRVAIAAKAGKVLRYIGRVHGTRCAVTLQTVAKDSPFGGLSGGDNLVVFTTQRYRTNPLIVRGPGAGPDVTAGGVLADILKVATLLTT